MWDTEEKLTDARECPSELYSVLEAIPLDHIGGQDPARNSQSIGEGRDPVHRVTSLVVILGSNLQNQTIFSN